MRWNSDSAMPLLTCWYSGVRWYFANASFRLPFGDRQSRMRETRDATDDDDRENERAADEKPRGDGPMRERCHGRNYRMCAACDRDGQGYNARLSNALRQPLPGATNLSDPCVS
jgi:hypothetical protein